MQILPKSNNNIREEGLTSWHSQLYAGLLFILQTAAIVVTSQVQIMTNLTKLPSSCFFFFFCTLPSEPEAAVHNRSTTSNLSHIGAVQESSCSCPRGKAGDHCWTGHLPFIPSISLVIMKTISETLMQVVNLMSSDVGQVVMLGQHINFLWSCPLQVCPITNLCGS